MILYRRIPAKTYEETNGLALRRRRSVTRALAALAIVVFAAQSGHAQRASSPSIDQRIAAAARHLDARTIYDSEYRRPRKIWIYTPAGYYPRSATPYSLLVAFDGGDYQDTMPLPFILDTLLASGKAPAFVALLVDNGGGAERIA